MTWLQNFFQQFTDVNHFKLHSNEVMNHCYTRILIENFNIKLHLGVLENNADREV